MIQATSNMIFNNITNQLSNQSTTIYGLEQQVSSGLAINYPQDNPAGMANVLSYKNSSDLVTQYSSNVSAAGEISSLASSTLSNVVGVVNNAKTLALEMANGGTSSENQTAAANQVQQMINELIGYADTSYNGQNIFTGNNINISDAYTSSTAYYAASSNGSSTPVQYSLYTYSGTDATQKFQISKGESVSPSVTADAIFGSDAPITSSSSSPSSSVPSGLISVLSLFKSELKAGVFQSNSSDILNGIDNGLNNVLSAQATVGTITQRLNDQSTAYQTVLTNISQLISQTQDVNIAQATTNLTQAQDTYQATLETASSIMQLTPMLLNYIK